MQTSRDTRRRTRNPLTCNAPQLSCLASFGKMERGFIVLVAALVLHASPAVQGTAHLSFANGTQVNITRAGCGTAKLCVETPTRCDPAGNGSCLFVSVVASNAVAPSGANLSIQLQGESGGYVALGLSVNSGEATTLLFVCAANGTSGFFFSTVTRNISNAAVLMPNERIVSNIRGRVNGSRIACEFDIPDVNATTIGASTVSTRSAAATSFNLLLGIGPVTGGGVLGTFNLTRESGVLNLADPAANLAPAATPTATPTPAATPTNTTRPNAAVQPHAALQMLIVLSASAVLIGRS